MARRLETRAFIEELDEKNNNQILCSQSEKYALLQRYPLDVRPSARPAFGLCWLLTMTCMQTKDSECIHSAGRRGGGRDCASALPRGWTRGAFRLGGLVLSGTEIKGQGRETQQSAAPPRKAFAPLCFWVLSLLDRVVAECLRDDIGCWMLFVLAVGWAGCSL